MKITEKYEQKRTEEEKLQKGDIQDIKKNGGRCRRGKIKKKKDKESCCKKFI